MHPALWLTLAIASEIVATTSLKLSDGFSKLAPSVVVVVGYSISFWAMSISLRSIPRGVVYAIWSGVGTAAIVLIGYALFHEVLDAVKLGAIGLIVIGVILLNGAGAAAHSPRGSAPKRGTSRPARASKGQDAQVTDDAKIAHHADRSSGAHGGRRCQRRFRSTTTVSGPRSGPRVGASR